MIWNPHPGPQARLLEVPDQITEVFYGGARGGGKTDGCLGEWLAHYVRNPQHARGIFVRRVAEDLSDVILRSHLLFRPTGARWNAVQRTWYWPEGAVLRFRHLKDSLAAAHYQGHAYTRIYFEELGQWPMPDAYNLMRGTLRSAYGVPCKMIGTGNPGGPGHGWLKIRFYDDAPKGYTPMRDADTEEWRVFIPAKLEDNPSLMRGDPTYERRLRGAGNEALVRAWRWGVWDVVTGAYFSSVWEPRTQQLRPFPVPNTWRYRRSFDWGSASPSSLGLWAVSSGEPIREGLYRGRIFPRGSLVRVGEWYTVARDSAGQIKPNEGLRLSNTQLGVGIAKITKRVQPGLHRWQGCVADTQVFENNGGPSIMDQMQQGALEEGMPLVFMPADKRRVPGWQRLFQMLYQSSLPDPQQAGLWYLETCAQFQRTVPLLQMDERCMEDVMKAGEDHVGDETRYAAMTVRTADTGPISVELER